MPEYPSEALIASIQHQAEKLGYLVAQVEEMFANHAKHDRSEATVLHATKAGEITKQWLSGEISDENMANLSAILAMTTSDRYDEIKAVHQMNTNRLNEMVVEAINRGKKQQDELNKALDTILNEGEGNV
jgi:hypothetical protein